MRHGNLSNHGGIAIAFRLEDTIIQKKSNNRLPEFVRNFDRLYGYEPNDGVIATIDRIYRRTDYNIVIVVDKQNADKKIVREVLDGMRHGEIFVCDKLSQITTRLHTKMYEYYVDNNPLRIQEISTEGAVTFEEFTKSCVRVR